MPLVRVGTLLLVVFVATLPPAFIARAQIVINEIMQNPEFAGDTEGEWFELHNIGNLDVDLDGWTIRDDGSNNHIIDPEEPLIISPGGYLVLGRNADTLVNGNVPVTYAYGAEITFSNGADQLILENADGVEQDRVEYDDGLTFPDPTGASMELLHPGVDNNVGDFWKEATSSWDGNDNGTPGFANSVLDGTPPAVLSVLASEPTLVEVYFNEAVDPATSQTPGNYLIMPEVGIPVDARRDSTNPALIVLSVDTLLPGIPYTISIQNVTDLVGNAIAPGVYPFSLGDPLAEGDIIITEIMNDPSAVGDSDGEWFEVYNVTESPIDMNGWSVSDGGSNEFVVQEAFVIPPRSFGVFCVNMDSSANGGFSSPVVYDWGTSGTFTLGNTADKIIITSDGLLVDSVSYDGGTSWPDLTGATMGLADFSSENNIGENWTASTSRQPHYSIGAGDLGSPGTLGDNQSIGSGPQIEVSPDSFHIKIGTDETVNRALLITNTGSETLTWSISFGVTTSTCPWLTVMPSEGEVSAGQTDTVRTRFSSEGLPAGIHGCTITVESSDEHSSITVIPVLLEVVDATISGAVTIPDDLLPIPAEGDTVEMDIQLVNNTDIRREADVWITLLRPGAPEPRQIIDVRPLRLSSLETLEKIRSLRIPSTAPPGTYALELHVGAYPDSLLFTSTFVFEKEDMNGTVNTGLRVSGLPVQDFLDQSYPSPFNASTTILYGLSEDTWVTLRVYDLLGRETATLVNEFQFAGYKSISWNGRNNDGNVSASGTYIYQIRAGDFSRTRTMVFVK